MGDLLVWETLRCMGDPQVYGGPSGVWRTLRIWETLLGMGDPPRYGRPSYPGYICLPYPSW